MARGGRLRLPVLHGTLAGERSHRNAREPVCDACKAAAASYRAGLRRKRTEEGWAS